MFAPPFLGYQQGMIPGAKIADAEEESRKSLATTLAAL
jgi:hypothetical protein